MKVSFVRQCNWYPNKDLMEPKISCEEESTWSLLLVARHALEAKKTELGSIPGGHSKRVVLFCVTRVSGPLCYDSS